MANKINIIIVFLLIVSVSFNLFSLINKSRAVKTRDISSPSEAINTLNLVSPLKQGETLETNETLHYVGLKPKLDQIISASEAEKVGLFLQDSKTGAWLGINEKEGFVPASLLKIPVMMGVLKKLERQEVTMTDQIELIQSDLDCAAGDLCKEGPGKKFTVWDLIKKMILASDNTAKNALKRLMANEELNAVFAHVGIPNPYLEENSHTVTPRDYTRLFKSLYFSTFLPPALSQKALDIATDTEMESLISAGVPTEITVSHKFGERPDGISDCGIIYTDSPYFLCIMVKGTDISKAKNLIAELSKTIYNYIEMTISPTPSSEKK